MRCVECGREACHLCAECNAPLCHSSGRRASMSGPAEPSCIEAHAMAHEETQEETA
jgi:hypothetical protein